MAGLDPAEREQVQRACQAYDSMHEYIPMHWLANPADLRTGSGTGRTVPMRRIQEIFPELCVEVLHAVVRAVETRS